VCANKGRKGFLPIFEMGGDRQDVQERVEPSFPTPTI
jgi:hypothetical protein